MQSCPSGGASGGDPTLKARIKQGAGGQHDAIVTWAVEGAKRWYADPARSLTMTTKVEADTRAWRSEADRIMGFWSERLPRACARLRNGVPYVRKKLGDGFALLGHSDLSP
jgi:hypothetical protein